MARNLLELAQDIEETMWSVADQMTGHIVIGCTTTAGKYALPLLAAAFNREYPNVRVTIRMCEPGSAAEPLLADEVHLGISDSKIVHPAIECQPFFTDQVILVAPSEHPFAKRSSIEPDELLEQPFILREKGCSTCRIIGDALAEHGISLDQLRIVMSVGNSEAIEMAVEHAVGIAFISRLAASRGLESGRLAEVPVEGMCLERSLFVARNASSAKTPPEDRLWNFVEEHRERIFHMLDT
jgi:DNA-binding transcriptional LysR family regulator